MGKAPAFQFYVRDWLSDPQLSMASFKTKGMWIDLLCFMWEAPERGKLVGSYQQIGKLIGATEDEIKGFFDEVSILGFASNAECNGIVTLINRRMYNEWKDKESTRLRVSKHRSREICNADCNGACNGNVTPYSSTSSSTSTSYKDKILYLECVYLTNDEHKKLISKFGSQLTDRAIFILNNYLMGKGKDPYKSHYHTILGWPIEKAQESQGKPFQQPLKQAKPMKICDHCGNDTPETVVFKEKNVCQNCIKTLDPAIDGKIEKILTSMIKPVPSGNDLSHAELVKQQAYKIMKGDK